MDGLYYGTAFERVYAVAPRGGLWEMVQSAFQITGNTVNGVERLNGGATATFTATLQLAAPHNGRFSVTCGTYSGPTSFTYTASGNVIKLYTPYTYLGLTFTLEEVLTRQGS